MRMVIGKHFEFEAAHQLPADECYGKCRNLHGHTYKLVVEVTGLINDKGWLANFSSIKEIVKTKVIDKLDHKFLNLVEGLGVTVYQLGDGKTSVTQYPTTAERILLWINDQIEQPILNLEEGVNLSRLRLYETSNSYAELILQNGT